MNSSQARTQYKTLTQEVDGLITKAETADLSMQQIIQELGMRGHAFITLILGTPFCSPLPTFGLSTIFGLVISFVSVFIILKQEPYIPQKYRTQKIPKAQLLGFLKFSKKFLGFLQKFIKPRFHFFSKIFPIQTVSAVLICVCGILLALPLPPGTNAPPAIAIVFLSLGLLEEDYLFFLLGFLMFILNLVLFGAMIFAGASAVDYVLQYFR